MEYVQEDQIDKWVANCDRVLRKRDDLVFSFIDISVKDENGSFYQETVQVLIPKDQYDKLERLRVAQTISEISATGGIDEIINDGYAVGRTIQVAELEEDFGGDEELEKMVKGFK